MLTYEKWALKSDRMEMQTLRGYKKTEAGNIPSDWNVARIDTICRLVNGRGFKPHEWKKVGLPIIRIQNLNGSEDYNYYDGAYDKKILIENGELLFAWSGSVGTSFGPHIWQGHTALLNYHTWKIEVNETKITKEYYLHLLQQLTKKIEERSHGASALVHTQKQEMENFIISFPASQKEQTSIAAVLNDADALIFNLEKLLAKKRNIRQGAMQQLLTGITRLPGFTGKWVKRTIQESSFLKARIGWQGLTTKEYLESGDYYLVTGTDFIDGKINWGTCAFVARNRYSQDKNIQLRIGDVLLTKDGTIGKTAYVNEVPKPATLNSGVFVIRPNQNDYLPLFLYYVLNSVTFYKFLSELSAGSTIVHIYQKDFIHFSFAVPPTLKEQEAISFAIRDTDIEIEKLEQKLSKYRMIKQGMMQNLLTGKIRLM